MRKYVEIVICIVLGIVLFPMCFNYNKKNYPNEYYNVYLDNEFLGTISSKSDLLSYIENNTQKLINTSSVIKTYCEDDSSLEEVIAKNNATTLITANNAKYYKDGSKDCVDITLTTGDDIEKIYEPIGLEIEKTLTYQKQINTIEDIYKKIADKKSFTIKGYQFTVTNGEIVKNIYVTDKNIFEEAVKKFIEVYVGSDEYESYIKGTQSEIKSTGSVLENIYIQENISVKEKQIPIDYKIYTNASDLSQFLIYGDSTESSIYRVRNNQMISDVAMANEISDKEFLIANTKYKNENSLIAVGTEVIIRPTNPQLKVVVEKYVVEDKTVNYKTIYEHDESQYVDYVKTTQTGKDGLQRVSQRVKIVNGSIVYIEPKGKETLRNTVDEIVVKGDKTKPNVGDLNNWAWPSESGWTTTDGYSWRINPVTGVRHFHYGIDIAGTGYGSAIYSANNGTIVTKSYQDDFGYYIIIDHNNGYYTLYAHMSDFYPGINVGNTILRGQQIGYVGSTGQSTGPHIHFEVHRGCLFNCERVNPWSIYQ